MTDRSVRYDDNGDDLIDSQINYLYDTTGKYLGELTGTNDAQVVVDAIADRASGASVIVPDPGFDLDWEQQVDLPTGEQGFALETIGVPRLAIPSGFSGTAAINKPADTASNAQLTGLRIGSFTIDGGAASASDIDRAIVVDDQKEGVIEPSLFFDIPAIYLKASNGTTNQIEIRKPYIKSERGPGIELQGGTTSRVDQCRIVNPLFNDRINGTETAYLDLGNDNSWHATRIESAATAYIVGESTRGGEGYYIEEQDWDRISDNAAIVERANAEGRIETSKSDTYTRSRIVSPITHITGIGEATGGGPQAAPVNLLAGFERATEAMSVSDLGLNTFGAGSGGWSIGNPDGGGPRLTGTTDTSSGNAAGLNLGGSFNSIGASAVPKFALRSGPNTPTSNVLLKIGFETSNGDIAQLIFDPTDSLTEAPTAGNWYFRTETGAGDNSQDMGASPSSDQVLAVGIYKRASEDIWYARVGDTVVEDNVGSNGPSSNIEWLANIETKTSSSKTWDLSSGFQARLWRIA